MKKKKKGKKRETKRSRQTAWRSVPSLLDTPGSYLDRNNHQNHKEKKKKKKKKRLKTRVIII